MKPLSGTMFAFYIFAASLGWLVHGVKEMMIVLLTVSFFRLVIHFISNGRD